MRRFFRVGSIGIEVLFGSIWMLLGLRSFGSGSSGLLFFFPSRILNSFIVTVRRRVLLFGVGLVLIRFCFIVLEFL